VLDLWFERVVRCRLTRWAAGNSRPYRDPRPGQLIAMHRSNAVGAKNW